MYASTNENKQTLMILIYLCYNKLLFCPNLKKQKFLLKRFAKCKLNYFPFNYSNSNLKNSFRKCNQSRFLSDYTRFKKNILHNPNPFQ